MYLNYFIFSNKLNKFLKRKKKVNKKKLINLLINSG